MNRIGFPLRRFELFRELVFMLFYHGGFLCGNVRVLTACSADVEVGFELAVTVVDWSEWRFYFFIEQCLLIHTFEPFMAQYFLVSAFRPETLRWVLCQQLLNDVLDLLGVRESFVLLTARKDELRGHDPLHHFVKAGTTVERVIAEKQLEDDDTDGPPVDSETVARSLVHLRRHVLWSAHAGAGLLRFAAERPCKPKIDQLDVAVLINEYVL